ncbi:MAG: hypothetical protein ACTSYX_04865 [Candidatus Thorarchaeota archaeon]
MNAEEFERNWRDIERRFGRAAADRYRRRWNRYVISKHTTRRLPPIYLKTAYEEVVNWANNRAVSRRVSVPRE